MSVLSRIEAALLRIADACSPVEPFRFLVGDALAVLRGLPSGAAQMACTSPPYFGLRSYLPAGHPDKAREIGTEETPDEYVAKLAGVFREVRRVLRDDGVLWLNIGDSYAASGPSRHYNTGGALGSDGKAGRIRRLHRDCGIKDKDLLGIPWMLAFALRADGWWLRSDVIWHKPNPMPASVKDRPTGAHEHLFLLAKRETYFFDAAAIAEPAVGQNHHDLTGGRYAAPGQAPHTGTRKALPGGTRNARDVWTIPTQPCKEAHFAVMPSRLAERCIMAGSRPGALVLDPFGGAGTTALAALRHGRRAVLVDLDPRNQAIARRRVAEGLARR